MSGNSSSVLDSGRVTADVVVKRWSKHNAKIDVGPGEGVHYEWKLKAHDIGFEAYFLVSGDSKRSELSAYARISDASKVWQHGEFTNTSDAHGTLVLFFDNTYSKLRDKTVSLSYTVHAQAIESSLKPGARVMTDFGIATLEKLRTEDMMWVVALPWGRAYVRSDALHTDDMEPISANERALVGVGMFFNNRIHDSEAFFQSDIKKEPVFALGYGAIGFLKGMMTWDRPELESAQDRLKHANDFAANFLPKYGISSYLYNSSTTKLSQSELEANLITAESGILVGLLNLVTNESLAGLLKAGMAMRTSWKYYSICFRALQAQKKAEPGFKDQHTYDDESVISGIQFGVGAFNVIISILPPIVLKIIAILGFPSDRDAGLNLLHECSRGLGIRSPLAMLLLLNYYIIVPSFFSVSPKAEAKRAHDVLTLALTQFPVSALYWWLGGRLRRNQRDLNAAIVAFDTAAAGNRAWPQLQHLIAYELGWTYYYQLEYERGRPYWELLYKENSWSKATFYYMSVLAAIERNESMEIISNMATTCLAEIKNSKKIGGKLLSVEQYIFRRCSQMVTGYLPDLAAIEMTYIFYGFPQMDTPLLKQVLHKVETALHDTTLEVPRRAVLCLVRGGCLKALGQYVEAAKELLTVTQLPLKSLKDDGYVIPFSYYELGGLYMGANLPDEINWNAVTVSDIDNKNTTAAPAAALRLGHNNDDEKEENEEFYVNFETADAYFAKAKKFKPDYNFKIRLEFRIHLASMEKRRLTALIRGEKTTVTTEDSLAWGDALNRELEEAKQMDDVEMD